MGQDGILGNPRTLQDDCRDDNLEERGKCCAPVYLRNEVGRDELCGCGATVVVDRESSKRESNFGVRIINYAGIKVSCYL